MILILIRITIDDFFLIFLIYLYQKYFLKNNILIYYFENIIFLDKFCQICQIISLYTVLDVSETTS